MLEPKYIVKFGEKVPEESKALYGEECLNVSEFFYDTIQGEGMSLGQPAAFLRLAGCPVNCEFCDTAAVWKQAKTVKISWLVDQIIQSGLGEKLEKGDEILVVTGGSPLLQQKHLISFFKVLDSKLKNFYVEVENEVFFPVQDELKDYVDWWNNSPKLSNSGVPLERRYNPKAIMSLPQNSTFKFVVKDEKDWDEITEYYLGLIQKCQICLMPMGADQAEYFANREKVVELAVEHGVRYSPREHIAIWNKKTGI